MQNNRLIAGDRIYLAAPLFNEQERSFNCALAEILEKGFSVYLPQRDGTLIPGKILDRDAFIRAADEVYTNDIHALRESDGIICVLDGRAIDEGVAFELGYANALGKACCGVCTDSRVLLPHGHNPMISRPLQETFSSLAGVAAWVESLLEASENGKEVSGSR